MLFNPIEKFRDLQRQSATLPVSMPTRDNRVERIAAFDIFKKAKIRRDAKKASVVLDQAVLQLIDSFLLVKREFGTAKEKSVYALLDRDLFIRRLFTKKAITFSGKWDKCSLKRDGSKARGPSSVKLEDYLSYDEMGIAALLGVSTPLFFINDGNRANKGQQCKERGAFANRGTIVGLSGTRFDVRGRLDYRHMIVDELCTDKNGYGDLKQVSGRGCRPRKKPRLSGLQSRVLLLRAWATFYDSIKVNTHQVESSEFYFPTYQEAVEEHEKSRNEAFAVVSVLQRNPSAKPVFLNVLVFKKRVALLARTLLLEANRVGEAKRKNVLLHVSDFGLERYKLLRKQAKWIFEEFLGPAKNLPLTRVAVIHFSNYPPATLALLWGQPTLYSKAGLTIRIEVSNRSIAELYPSYPEHVLVTSFNCNANSFPGNEYWSKKLQCSSESAAACASTIPQLLNPLTNNFYENIRVFS